LTNSRKLKISDGKAQNSYNIPGRRVVITAGLMLNKIHPYLLHPKRLQQFTENTHGKAILFSGKEKSQGNRQLLDSVKRHTNEDLLESVNRQYDLDVEGQYVDECHLCYLTRRALLDRFPEYLAPKQVYGL